MPTPEQVIAELARGQHSVFTGEQATQRGVSRKMLRIRAASGRLDRLGQDLYHVAGVAVTWEARMLGHVLAAGEQALVSHRAAAALWGLEGYNRGTPELTVERGNRYRRTSIRVHESTDLDRCGRRVREGLPITDPSRTLLDLARRTGDARLLETIESARRLKLTTWEELSACLARHARPGRPGVRRLRRVIVGALHREEVTDSTFELLVLGLLVESGLPEPVVHHRLFGADGRFIAELDLAYPHLKIAIELDGRVHQQDDVFERDRVRQNDIVLQGWVVLRFTWADLRDRPETIVATVRAAIDRANALG